MEKKTVIINVETADGVQNLDRLSAKFDEIYGDVLPLTGAIGELEDQLYEMARAGQQNTDEFKAVAAEAGKLKKVIAQVDMEVDALSMTTANKLGGALGGVASGFAVVQGAMGAMGVESEKVEEALLAVNSAMAMAQGVQGLKEAVPAFKAIGQAGKAAFTSIKGAIIATGVGALVVAIGALAANWDSVKGATEKAANKAKDMVNDFANKYPKTFKAIKGYLEIAFWPITLAVKAAQKLYDVFTGTTEASRKAAAIAAENHKKRMDQLDAERKAQQQVMSDMEAKIALLEAEGKSTVELRKKKLELQKADAESTLQALEATKAMLGKNSVMAKSYDDLIKSSKDTLNRLAVEEAKLTKEVKDGEKEKAEARKAAQDEREKKADEARSKEYNAKLEELASEEYWNNLLLEEDKKRADAQKELNDKIAQDKEDSAFAEMAFNAKMRQQEIDADLEAEAKKAEGRKLLEKEKYQMAYNSLQLISDITDLFSTEDEKKARNAFKVKKALSIAQATISSIEGAQNAFTTASASPITTVFPAYPFIQAGLAGAFGAVKIAAIAKTQFGGGGSASSSGGGGGSTPAIASSPATFNVVGNSNTNQLMEGLSNSPVKAYVVSGDVTSAQSLDRNKRQIASL